MNHSLANRFFVLTGQLEHTSRQEAEAMLKSLGATIQHTVNKKTTDLVLGKNPGSKLQKAKALKHINILPESNLLELFK